MVEGLITEGMNLPIRFALEPSALRVSRLRANPPSFTGCGFVVGVN